MKGKIVTVFELTEMHVKVLQARVVRGSARVYHWDIREITDVSDEKMAAALKECSGATRVKIENLTAVIPRSLTMQRTVSLPSHSESEIAKMVHLQVIRQGPYSQEDVSYDYSVVSKDPTGYSRIMVVIVHKEVVHRYLNIFTRAGLTVNQLALSSLGPAGWYGYHQRKTRTKSDEVAAVLDVDSTSSEICFCRGDRLLFSRSVDFGARDMTPDQSSRLVEQFTLTLNAFNKEDVGEDVNKMFILSSLSEAAYLKERLSEGFSGDIEILNPYGYLDDVLRKLREVPMAGRGATMTVPQGIAILSGRRMINLMPEEVTDTRRVRQERKEWIRFGLLAFLIFVVVSGIMAFKVHRRSVYADKLREQLRALDPRIKRIEEYTERLKMIGQRTGSRAFVVDIIREIIRLTPARISYNLVDIGEDGSLDLKGLSEESVAVNDLQSNLAGSSMFSNVTLQYATKRRIFRGEVMDFRITCEVAVPKESNE